MKLVDCATVEDYLNELISTRHKLAQIGFQVNDRWMISILLLGLPKQYEPKTMGLEAAGIQMRVDTIRAKILKPDKSYVKCFRCNQPGHYVFECQREGKSEPKGYRDSFHRREQILPYLG